ncbi:hypothetical protein [Streptomyces roseoverticillatus]|uniref:hypothetical protein n=1 Tax=Streptomyces roseoverticillatus TaxID=66429 RepID=UPI003F546A2D
MARPSRKLTPDRSARHLFGADLRRHREAAGMTLDKLAEVVCYPAAVQARGRAYSLLTAYALSPTETAAFMRDAMEALSA